MRFIWIDGDMVSGIFASAPLSTMPTMLDAMNVTPFSSNDCTVTGFTHDHATRTVIFS